MDPLSDALRVVNFSGGVFLNAEFRAPWCVATKVGPEQCGRTVTSDSRLIPYHYVVEGEMRVRLLGGKGAEVSLRAGDVVLIPGNDVHVVGTDLNIAPIPASDVIVAAIGGGLATASIGGDGPLTRLVCGFLGGTHPAGNPLLAALPPLLKLDAGDGKAAEWVHTTFRFAAEEVAAGRIGSVAVLAKLSELLFVEAVRRYAEAVPDGDDGGWLAGLRDRHVGRALSLMHAAVNHDWTIEALSAEVGLSRSALAERFVRLIGKPPMQYLAAWRMQVAAQKLRDTGNPLARIGEEVGYGSEAAFSRAFKKEFGIPPATWRQTLAAA